MCMNVLLTGISVPHVSALYPWKSEEGLGFPEAGFVCTCDPTSGYLALNQGSPQEQQGS